MAREIEVRFKLDDAQKALLTNWLVANASEENETHHIEHYLDNPASTWIFQNKNGYKDSDHYLRVRKDEKKGDSVCLKIFEIDQEKQTSQNLDEIEFSVSDGDETLKLMKTLGYTNEIIIDKKRKKYLTNDGCFEICIDDVKGVGFFAEIELREQVEGDIKNGWQKIYTFLKELGFKEIDEQHRGYVSMLWNPEMNFGIVKKL
jgi:predicted adenylyl cyclase CyaB